MKQWESLPLYTRVIAIGIVLVAIASIFLWNSPAARSALVYTSEEYEAEIQQTHLGVALTENGEIVSDGSDQGALLSGFVMPEGGLFPGEWYDENISAENISDEGMDEYVRITVNKGWVKGASETPVSKMVDGEEMELNPALIQLTVNTKDWVVGEDNGTRMVLYYRYKLKPGDPPAPPAVTDFRISAAVDDFKAVGEAFDKANDIHLMLAAQVDSVQTHNAADAAMSAWGVDINALGLDWGE